MIVRILISIAGVVVTVIGALSIVGYLAGEVRLYGWIQGQIGMAPNTAIALFLAGTALTLLGASDRLWGTEK